eukprot:CAMPEP_0170536008 /NCGR_PEP_ID=MMETSP0209-20121228/101908_1 /TAXON_ID=665100 ORGANISM="Litonotus pictus, Strain P1" /NCGR_SAMPLE_ID=MMETSP0209 /ASSEMBLY_ACC=CAM_ASM_000301 /LENGTH=1000 /DNA_ID=CAMNT_0010837327 /DNA_START=214 /DNA_END=3216 /DNA_ORIENTATION=+
MIQDIWVKCAKEGETCKFSGERMVRYGATNGKWKYKPYTNSVKCNSSNFGSINTNGKAKVCFFQNVTHTWKRCAEENKSCSISGTAIIRYGRDSKNNYKQLTNNVNCKNSVFKDPYKGKKKYCDIMVNIYWKKCASEGNSCNFDGTTLVKYGYEKKWKIQELTHGTACNNSVFGDPYKGKKKSCVKRMGKYFWIECATEGGKCNDLPGAVIVKYGAKDKYKFKEAYNSISCKNSVFGDPIKGTKKKCYYAIYNVADAPESLNDLEAAEVNEPISASAVKANSSCDKGGFGFNGQCLSGQRDSGLPSDTDSALDFLGAIMYKATMNVDVCLGDWSGSSIKSNSYLQYNKCHTIPVVSDFDYGVIGFNAEEVPCGDPQLVQACAVWDQCGTVALSVNGGLVNCAANYTGVGAILGSLAKTLNYVSIGFSLKRLFTKSFDIAYNKGSSVDKKTITTFAHFYFKLGLKFPFADLKIGNQKVSNFFTINADMYLMLDFGDSLSVIEDFITDIRKGDSDTGENLVDNIINANFEVSLGITGSFVLNLNKLTQGFLPNLSFNLGEVNLLLTNGNGGSSGMNRGIYLYFKVGFNNISSLFQKIVDQFSGILSLFGLKIEIPNINASVGIGLFIQDDSAGIYLNAPGTQYFFTINADMYLMLDFGDSLSVIEDFVNDIRKGDSDTGENLIDNIINANFEVCLGIKGSFVLNLNKLTQGFLPNLSFNLGEVNLLLTNGNGGSSGMNRGIYLYFKVGFNNISSLFQTIVDQFSGILSLFGLKIEIPNINASVGIGLFIQDDSAGIYLSSLFGLKIEIPNINASVGIGLFIQDDSAGIYLNAPGTSLYCQFIYSTEKGSCDFNSQFFTALIEGAKWIIKHARQMFETAGKEIVRFSKDTAKFASKAAGAVSGYFNNNVKNFFQRDVKNALVNTGTDVKEFFQNDVGGAVNKAGKVISGKASGAIDALGNVAEDVGKALSTAFNDAGDALKDTGEDIKDVGESIGNAITSGSW